MVSVGRVYNHACFFINNKNIIIFIDNIEGNIFRDKFYLFRRGRKYYLNQISRFYLIVGFYRKTIDENIACICCILNPGSGDIHYPVCKILVNPDKSLSGIYLISVMFIQLLLFSRDFFFHSQYYLVFINRL